MGTERAGIVIEEKREGTGIITLNSPQTLNVLSTEMLKRLGESISRLSSGRDIRAVIVTGKRNFSAGADIKEMRGMGEKEAEAFSRLGHSVLGSIVESDKPFIAAVNGFALGGGCELALACDIRVAGNNARMGQPEVTIGLIPGFGATFRLPGVVGQAKAEELILTGKVLTAKEALSIGLVNMVVEEGGDGDLLAKAVEIAGAVSQKGPYALKAAKALIRRSAGFKEDMEKEISSFAGAFKTRDFIEGVSAFLEKRKARFSGE